MSVYVEGNGLKWALLQYWNVSVARGVHSALIVWSDRFSASDATQRHSFVLVSVCIPQHVVWLMWWFLEANNFINLQFFSIKPIWVLWLHTFIRRLFETFKWTRVQFLLNKDCPYKFIIKITLYCLSNLSFSAIMPFPELCTVFCLWSVVFPQLLNNVFVVLSQSLAWTVTRNQSGWIVTQLLAMTVHQWWAVSWNPALLSTVRRMRMLAGQTLLSVSVPWNNQMWICLAESARIHFLSNNDCSNLPTGMTAFHSNVICKAGQRIKYELWFIGQLKLFNHV